MSLSKNGNQGDVIAIVWKVGGEVDILVCVTSDGIVEVVLDSADDKVVVIDVAVGVTVVAVFNSIATSGLLRRSQMKELRRSKGLEKISLYQSPKISSPSQCFL